ncbi:MAG: NRDE family protein [Sphingomonadales bacterium]|nr:NRDE family protein [Sphingomonadales bacterium]
MCVAALAWRADPQWPLVVVANRDEYHERPAAALHAWPGGILAGQDLRSGGTWLGVNPAAGRLVLVTNFRVPGYPLPDRPSRGGLVTDLLGEGDAGAVAVAPYNPFNLFAVAGDEARFLTNHPGERRAAPGPGVHGLSNGPFDQPWPKAARLSTALSAWLPTGDNPAALFAALADPTPFPTDEAPGNGPEPHYSPVFIRNPVYGTRCSSVIAVDAEGRGVFMERRFGTDGAVSGETRLRFDWNRG